jgi:hypothetical protein
MKYSGLKTVEVRVCKNESVVNNLKSAAPPSSSPAPSAVAIASSADVFTPLAFAKLAAPVAPTIYVSEKTAVMPAPAARAASSPKKGRLISGLLKQIIICALVLAALLGLRFADSGFAEDVFTNIKDIVSYNYEISGNIYDEDGATFVGFIQGLFKAKNA